MSKRWSRRELAHHRREKYNQTFQDFIDGKIPLEKLNKRVDKLKQFGRLDY